MAKGIATTTFKMVDGQRVPLSADEVAARATEEAEFEAGRKSRAAARAQKRQDERELADRVGALEAQITAMRVEISALKSKVE